jgi:hypothetical protein
MNAKHTATMNLFLRFICQVNIRLVLPEFLYDQVKEKPLYKHVHGFVCTCYCFVRNSYSN